MTTEERARALAGAHEQDKDEMARRIAAVTQTFWARVHDTARLLFANAAWDCAAEEAFETAERFERAWDEWMAGRVRMVEGEP